MSQEGALDVTNGDASVSSVDSLNPKKQTSTHVPARAVPERPRSPPAPTDGANAGSRVFKALRGPSADEVLHGGRSAVSEEGNSQRESTTDSPENPRDTSSAMIRLASKQFFEEMGTVGIIAVEKGTFAIPVSPDTERSTTDYNAENVHVDAEASFRSPASRTTSDSLTDNCSRKRSPSQPSPLPRQETLAAPANGRPRESSGENRAERTAQVPGSGFSVPPPFPSPLSSTRRGENTKEGVAEKHIGFFPQTGAAPLTSAAQDFHLYHDTEMGYALGARCLPLSFPKYQSDEGERAIPITRLLQEEGRSIIAEEATLWRRRCHDLERTVVQLRQQISQMNPLPSSPHEGPESGASWKLEENAFNQENRRKSQTSHQKSPSPSPAENSSTADRDHRRKHSNRLSGECPASRGVSGSLAPRSVTPQTPDYGHMLRAMGTTESEFSLESDAADCAPAFQDLPWPGKRVRPEASHTGGGSGQTVTEANAKADNSAERTDGAALCGDGETEAKEQSFDDALEFLDHETKSGDEQNNGTPRGPKADNLPLVLAERQARELQQQLERARQEIDSLHTDLERHRLCRDELETKLLAQEEQMLAERDEVAHRVLGLQGEVAKARGASRAEDACSEVGDSKSVLGAVQFLAGVLSAETITVESKESAQKRIEEIRSALQSAASPTVFASAEATADFKRLIVSLAFAVDPDNNHGSLLASVEKGEATFEDMRAAAAAYVTLAQETADAHAAQLEALREELQVVRKDRNELIGEQCEQVRLLQEELLEKETEHLHLMERFEAMRVELESLRSEREALEPEPSLNNEPSGAEKAVDATEYERQLREKLEQETRDACRVLEEKLREQREGAEAAQRAQHKVFTERLASAQKQLCSVREGAEKEREKHERELAFLHNELEATRTALQAKEVALSIALREGIRESRYRDEKDNAAAVSDEVTQHTASPPSPLLASDPHRDGAFESLKIISSGARATSLSLSSSQGYSLGESTTTAQRGKSESGSQGAPVSDSRRSVGSGAAAVAGARPSASSSSMSATLARLLHAPSPDPPIDTKRDAPANSPSPAPTPSERRNQSSTAVVDHVREHHLESQPPPLNKAEAAALQRAEGTDHIGRLLQLSGRVPRREPPEPSWSPPSASPPSPVAVAAAAAASQQDGTRRVTFVGVPPLTPSPATSAKEEMPKVSPITTDYTAWAHEVSRSLSPSFGNSPTNTAFVQDDDDHSDSADLSALQPSTLSPGATTPDALPPPPSRASPPSSSLLRQRSSSAANTSPHEDGGKKHRFVKIGSLQRMREVWAKQESLLLGSPPSTGTGPTPSVRR